MNVLLLVLALFRISEAVVTVSFDGEFKACSNGKEMVNWDLSKFDVLMLDKENITLNGDIVIIKDYHSPINVKITAERNVHNTWITAFVRVIPNFCDVIRAPNEMWTTVIQHFQQQECPYLAGHVEHFDNANIGNMATKLTVPPQFLGDWRLTIEVGTVRDGALVNECLRMDVLVEDL